MLISPIIDIVAPSSEQRLSPPEVLCKLTLSLKSAAGIAAPLLGALSQPPKYQLWLQNPFFMALQSAAPGQR